MTTFIQYALLGVGVGAGLALLSVGLVVIHTGSGVVNFAQGAMAMVGAFTFYTFHQQHHLPLAVAMALAIAIPAAIGLLVYQLLMRPLRSAPALVRLMATIGVFLLLIGLGSVVWGDLSVFANSLLPSKQVSLGGSIAIGEDRLLLLGIALALTAAVWSVVRFTDLGIGIRASAENEWAATTLGWSPALLGSVTWVTGGALAGLAGVLIAPQSSLEVQGISLLVIPVLAAALAAGFRSLWGTALAAIAIGMVQSLLVNYSTLPGIQTAAPFAIIIVVLFLRGQSLPLRGVDLSARLPAVTTGRIRPVPLIIATAAVLLVTLTVLSAGLSEALIVSAAWAIILLSVVVVIGFTGQINLAPFAFAGLGALVAAQLVSRASFPFELALLAGGLVAIPIGVLCGIPALRARGLNLAVITLGLGVTVQAMVFGNSTLSGGALTGGIEVSSPTVFGIDVNPFTNPSLYLALTILVFILLALMISTVRRGRVGRRLLAVRTNERAAAAMGVNVLEAKLYAFALSASVAAFGGVLLAFKQSTVQVFEVFTPVMSLLAVVAAVIGGIGFVMGSVLGSILAVGGLGTWIEQELFPGASPAWIQVVGGTVMLLTLLLAPDGQVPLLARQVADLGSKLTGLRRQRDKPVAAPTSTGPTPPEPADQDTTEHIRQGELVVRGATVRYGAVLAVDDVSFSVAPGEVVALIGPNGAGKTTLIDAVTGFAPLAAGEVSIRGQRVDRWPAYRRARAGISRSFQQLELLEDETVEENLRVASERRDRRAYATNLFVARTEPLPPATRSAIAELGLGQWLEQLASDLPYGTRRLTAIARAIASAPAVLLLDEPAAGLSQEETAELRSVVRRVATRWGIGVLVVEHDMSFVMTACDRIHVIDQGRTLAEGTPAEIQANPAVIAAYLGEPGDEKPHSIGGGEPVAKTSDAGKERAR